MASFRDYKDGPTRIDARIGESKINGVRNARRDMSGNVAGGIMPDGSRFGMQTTPVKTPTGQAPAWKRPQTSITPRLDGGSPTPRLDATRDPATVGESFAQTEARKRKTSAASGAFGTRPQNLAQRQSLYADMQAAGSGGLTPGMQQQAKKLGVSDAAWNRVAGKIPTAPAAIAAQGPASPSPAPRGAAPAATMAATPAATPPLQGKALAQQNIATMGTQGAVQDYFKRAGAEKAQMAARKPAWKPQMQGLPASAMPAAPVPAAPQNFTVPPVASPVAIGAETAPRTPMPPAPVPSVADPLAQADAAWSTANAQIATQAATASADRASRNQGMRKKLATGTNGALPRAYTPAGTAPGSVEADIRRRENAMQGEQWRAERARQRKAKQSM